MTSTAFSIRRSLTPNASAWACLTITARSCCARFPWVLAVSVRYRPCLLRAPQARHELEYSDDYSVHSADWQLNPGDLESRAPQGAAEGLTQPLLASSSAPDNNERTNGGGGGGRRLSDPGASPFHDAAVRGTGEDETVAVRRAQAAALSSGRKSAMDEAAEAAIAAVDGERRDGLAELPSVAASDGAGAVSPFAAAAAAAGASVSGEGAGGSGGEITSAGSDGALLVAAARGGGGGGASFDPLQRRSFSSRFASGRGGWIAQAPLSPIKKLSLDSTR